MKCYVIWNLYLNLRLFFYGRDENAHHSHPFWPSSVRPPGAHRSQHDIATVYLLVVTALWFPGHSQQQPTASLINSDPNRGDEPHESTCLDMTQHIHTHTAGHVQYRLMVSTPPYHLTSLCMRTHLQCLCFFHVFVPDYIILVHVVTEDQYTS